MSGKNRISAADLPARYQAQIAAMLNESVKSLPSPKEVGDLLYKNSPFGAAAPKKRLRQSTKPLMNKLETAFYEHLTRTLLPSMVLVQAISLRLGNGIAYRPDFFTPTVACMGDYHFGTFYEVKGPKVFRGGFENLKVAAHTYPFFVFALVWLDDCTWQEQIVLP
jgi:hypothetical protein